MATISIYMVQTFTRCGKRLIGAQPINAASEAEARRRAERMATATGIVGALAL